MWDTIIINPMTNILVWIYDALGHGPHMFGLAIILFTILIKIITWPLNASGYSKEICERQGKACAGTNAHL